MKNTWPEWLDCRAAAEYCSMGRTKIQEIFRRADFPVQWIGNKKVVKREDLDRYIESGRAS
jgi:hypothetical protein